MKVIHAFSKIYPDSEKKLIAVFDDSLYFDFLDYKLISAKQPLQKVGATAFEMLLALMNKETPKEQLATLDVEIIERNI